MFGIVIGVAMILNMIVATITGYLVPIVLKKFKVDPALASSIFVTTFTDVLVLISTVVVFRPPHLCTTTLFSSVFTISIT